MEKKSAIKALICKLAKIEAKNSVGKSLPKFVHEPKVPECLKNNLKK